MKIPNKAYSNTMNQINIQSGMAEKKESKADTAGGLVFVGSLMIGLGLGIYYNITAVGALVGLGVGFVLFGIIRAVMK